MFKTRDKTAIKDIEDKINSMTISDTKFMLKNVTVTTVIDVNNTSQAEIANVLCTLITVLKKSGFEI